MAVQEETNTYTLTITFVGLCLFYGEPNVDSPEVMHVLLPPEIPGMGTHVAMLCYQSSYLQPSGTGGGDWQQTSLAGADLELTGHGRPDTALDVTALPNIFAGSQRGINREVLDPDAGKWLAARVRLKAGSCTGYGLGSCWWYPDQQTKQMMANGLTWTIELHQDSLDLALAPFDGGAARALPTLYPDASGNIALSIYHTIEADLPPAPVTGPAPEKGSKEPDFAAYYSVLEGPLDANWPVPSYYGTDCAGSSAGPYTCMSAVLVPPS
jgi:hypothetical protein